MQETRKGHKGTEAKYFKVESSKNNLSNIVDQQCKFTPQRRIKNLWPNLGVGKNDQLRTDIFITTDRDSNGEGIHANRSGRSCDQGYETWLAITKLYRNLQSLTLPRLRQTLQSHYKEKSGTQLC